MISSRFSLIIFTLFFVSACSPKFPLHKSEGDRVKIKLVNDEIVFPTILDGDAQTLLLLLEDSLYYMDSSSIKYIKVLGYNETETFLFVIPSALTFVIGTMTVVTSFSGPGLTLLALGTLGLVLGASSSKKFRLTPSHEDYISRLRLHFRYPQGLSPEQKESLLNHHGQKKFKTWELSRNEE